MDFISTLIKWYAVYKRDLPWRITKDPYKIWLSEIILQQTQIKQGLPYYETFTTNFPTVFDLANATEDKVLKLWQGLGYYSRARNLHTTAKYIAEHRKGKFPKNYNGLLQLKGVGDYTASAIASICYEEQVAVLDGNVFRVLSRFFGILTPINSSEGKRQFKVLAQSLLPKKNIGDYNQAIMEFGALQCVPKSPNCLQCLVSAACNAAQTGQVSKLPIKIKNKIIKSRFLNFIILISKDKKTVLEQRTQKGIWQNLYQFPLIETQYAVDQKELLSDPKLNLISGGDFYNFESYKQKEIVHKLTHQILHIKFWICRTNRIQKNSIPWTTISSYAVPKPLETFINEFVP